MLLKNKDGNKKKHDANFQVLISDLKSAKKLYKNHFTPRRCIFFQNLTSKAAL